MTISTDDMPYTIIYYRIIRADRTSGKVAYSIFEGKMGGLLRSSCLLPTSHFVMQCSNNAIAKTFLLKKATLSRCGVETQNDLRNLF